MIGPIRIRMGACLVAHLGWPRVSPTVTHSIGFPPELTGGVDFQQRLGAPVLLVITQDPGGACMLYRYDEDGGPVGDTWHACLEEAKRQVEFEFPDVTAEWREVPGGASDPVAFGLAL